MRRTDKTWMDYDELTKPFLDPESEEAAGAVAIVMREDLNKASDKDGKMKELVADYADKFQNPYKAAELGYIDEIIRPQDTRPRLIGALEMLQNKRDRNPPKKHGNIPL